MTALTHKENDLHNRLIVAEFNLGQVEEELRRLHEENKALRARLAQPEPKRKWQWLTEDEIDKILDSAGSKLSAILLVEAQLRGKNI